MELIFVDESGDAKHKGYIGLCVAAINASHYKAVKNGFQDILRGSAWDESIEFKGSHLFSASSGDTRVSVDERIDIASNVLALNTSDKNARFRFHYSRIKDSADEKVDYLKTLPLLLKKALSRAKKGRGRDLVSVFCDYRSDIRHDEVHDAVLPAIVDRGYTLVETVTQQHSNFNTVGILYADLVSYLSARKDIIQNDLDLFEDIPESLLKTSGKVRKLKSSTELIDLIKRFDSHELD